MMFYIFRSENIALFVRIRPKVFAWYGTKVQVCCVSSQDTMFCAECLQTSTYFCAKTFLFEIVTDFIVPLFYEQDIAVFDGTFTVFKFFTKLKDTDILPSVRSTEALRTWRLFSLRLLKGNI